MADGDLAVDSAVGLERRDDSVVVGQSGTTSAEAVEEGKAYLASSLDHRDGGRTVSELDEVHDVELDK